MTVHFANGKTATVERCSLSRMFGGDSFNVLLPPDASASDAVAAKVVVLRTAAEVVAFLTKMARQAR